MQRFALPLICLLLAACQTIPIEAPRPGLPGPPDLAKCGGTPILALMGRPVSEMPATGGWGRLRVIGPDMAVTQDYSDSRLNVQIDGEGRIIGAYCG